MITSKYRSDRPTLQPDGATIWQTEWFGGLTLTKVSKCRLANIRGEPRVTVFVTSEPDTHFSIPTKFHYLGKVLNGYLTSDNDGNLVCHHCYY